MQTFIPTKQDLEEIVNKAVERTIQETLPAAIRKAKRKEWLTTEDVMEMLRCSRRHVQYLRDSGKLKFYQESRTIRYHVDDVEAYLNKGKVEVRK